MTYPPASVRRFFLISSFTLGVFAATAAPTRADVADDLQSMIERARNGVSDLERLDAHNAVRVDLTLLRVWLDEAWRLRSEQKEDEVREVLTRCDAQADMIRQKITASNLEADASAKEAEVKRLRDQIEKTKKAISAATLQKAALEAKSKK